MKYRTFIRSCTNWVEFAQAEKRTVDTHLSLDEARRACEAYNDSRTEAQIKKGTKMEFEKES